MTVVSLIRKSSLRLNAADDVVIAARPLAAGTRLEEEGLVCADAIPAGHKVATRAIAKGQPVRRYNQIIGFASQDIAAGQHVHSHNLAFDGFARDYAIGVDVKPNPVATEPASFNGYVRADGRIATRNYIGVISTVNCSASVSKYVAAHFTPERLAAFPNVDGVVAITHSVGCGMDTNGKGMDVLRRTIAGYVRHPNFAGVVMIGLGCEANQMDALFQTQGLDEDTMLKPLIIQSSGGSRKTVQAGIEAVDAMLPIANRLERQPVPAAWLTVGLQCGGSDGYSGISANPALGAACDLVVAHGGTVILSETPEIYGAEHLLTRRAVSAEVAQKLIDRIHWWEGLHRAQRRQHGQQPIAGQQGGRPDDDPREVARCRRQGRHHQPGRRLSTMPKRSPARAWCSWTRPATTRSRPPDRLPAAPT